MVPRAYARATRHELTFDYFDNIGVFSSHCFGQRPNESVSRPAVRSATAPQQTVFSIYFTKQMSCMQKLSPPLIFWNERIKSWSLRVIQLRLSRQMKHLASPSKPWWSIQFEVPLLSAISKRGDMIPCHALRKSYGYNIDEKLPRDDAKPNKKAESPLAFREALVRATDCRATELSKKYLKNDGWYPDAPKVLVA